MSLFKTKKDVTDSVTDLRTQIRAKESEREGFLQRSDVLQSLPSTKEDALAQIFTTMDQKASRYKESMSHQLANSILQGNALNLPQSYPVFSPWTGKDSDHITAWSLLALLGPEIKEGLRRVFADLDWPEPGPPLDERRRELKKIEKALEKVDGELAELRAIASEIGLQV